MIILRDKNYSDQDRLILVQKEFGIKNVYKNMTHLKESIKNDMDESNMATVANDILKFGNIKITSPELKNKLIKYAEDKGVKVLHFDKSGKSYIIGHKTAKNQDLVNKVNRTSGIDKSKEVEDAINNNKDLINYDPNNGVEELAHELGHYNNSKSKNPIKRLINKIANRPITRAKIDRSKVVGNDGSKSILDGVGRYINKRAIDFEEKGATKEGLKLLRDFGANDSEIRIADTKLKNAWKTYKKGNAPYYKYPFLNRINPSEAPKTKVNLKEEVIKLNNKKKL